MRSPALLVFTAPHLHGMRVVLDLSVRGIKLQFAVYLPRNVGKLKHSNGNVAYCNRSIELLSLANSRNEVGKVQICHRVAASKVRRRGRFAGLEFARLVTFQIVDLVTIAIDQHRASCPHDRRSTITVVVLHPIAAFALPRDHLVVVVETGHQCVVELPIVLELISPSRRGDPMRIVNSKRPTTDINLVRAIVERLASTPGLEPMPVVRLHIVFIRLTRGWSLPKIPIQLSRYRHFLSCPDRLPDIAVPGFGEVSPSDNPIVDLIDDFNGVRRGALLSPHLHELLILLLSLHQERPFGRVVAAGLFYIDALTRLQPGNGHRSMPVVGSGDRDSVHILLLKDVAKVLVGRGRLTHLFLCAVSKLLEDVAVYIADIRNSCSILIGLERRKMSVGAPIQPNNGKIETIIGAENLTIALCCRFDSQPCCS